MKFHLIDSIRAMSAVDMKKIMDGKTKGYILLDVRQPEEYVAGHIPGAVSIPLGELEHRYRELEKGKRVIALCRSGRRSMGASLLLRGMGFREICILDGGLLNWSCDMVKGPPERGAELVADVVEAQEALLLAFENENYLLAFYSDACQRLGGNRLLSILQETEEKHVKTVYQEITRHWNGHPPTLDEFKQRLGNRARSRDNPGAGDQTEFEFRDDLELLEAAIEMEVKAYELYKRIGYQFEDAGLRNTLQRLASEERVHIQQLCGEIKYFNSGE
ncbi:MAG: hypothetical protein IBX68_08370 [Dehalococcoidia bacterium]|nr:hypothetical protein [Dehalococcoidia bacterium]